MVKTINIIGTGNVGSHLVKAFEEKSLGKGLNVNRVDPHTLYGLCQEAELTIIAVSDSAIEGIAARLGKVQGVVAHTSGATPLSLLLEYVDRPGVFYPMQTFTKGRDIDCSEVPLLIEALDDKDLEILQNYAGILSNKVININSLSRARLHLAATFLNNFTTHIIGASRKILKAEGLESDLLNPLLTETIAKLKEMSASEAQTGPARRCDLQTIEIHKQLLSDEPELRKLYEDISGSILREYRGAKH